LVGIISRANLVRVLAGYRERAETGVDNDDRAIRDRLLAELKRLRVVQGAKVVQDLGARHNRQGRRRASLDLRRPIRRGETGIACRSREHRGRSAGGKASRPYSLNPTILNARMKAGYVTGLWMVALTILLIPSNRVLAAEPGESVFKKNCAICNTLEPGK